MEQSAKPPVRIIAFSGKDSNTSPEIAALEVADIEGLGREFYATGMSVNFCDAKIKGTEIWVPITGPGDIETIQHFFKIPIRAVSRKELIISCSSDMSGFTIRNFSNKRDVKDFEELIEILVREYKGKSVSVQYTCKNGILKSQFVDIDHDGVIRHTYKDKRIVDLADLKNT